jgi:hypothetical protein
MFLISQKCNYLGTATKIKHICEKIRRRVKPGNAYYAAKNLFYHLLLKISLSLAHAHTHTKHANVCTLARMCEHAYTYISTHAHTYGSTHTRAHMHTLTRTHAHTHAHTHTHTHIYIYMRARACTNAHTRTSTYACMHTHTFFNSPALVLYACKTWPLTFGEKHKTWLKRKRLGKWFIPSKDEVTSQIRPLYMWRK